MSYGRIDLIYYFAKDEYRKLLNENASTKYLKEKCEDELEKIKNDIKRAVQKKTHNTNDLGLAWTSRKSLGYVFIDFEREGGRKPIIGDGQTSLFKRIHQKYAHVVLTKGAPFIRREVDFDDEGPILIIDVEKFKKISQIMKNDPASAILYAFENDEIENIFIRLWSESPEKFKEFQQEHIVAEKNFFTLLAQLKPDTIEELNDIIRDSTSILNKKIAENYQKFNERLEEFRRLFEKEGLTTEENSYLENKIKEHLHKNPWIIDLTYDSDSVDTRQHDYVDVFLVNSYFGIKKGVIIELKRPDAKTEKTYRDRKAIRSAVTDAIGQLIHYTEDVLEDEIKNAKEDDPSLFVEGMIIIGNNMKEFHQVFNKYLHNVRIKSYREIYDDATKRLRTLTQGPSEESKENILEQ